MTKAKTVITPKVKVTKKAEVTVAKYPKIGRGIVTQVGEEQFQIKGINGGILTFKDYYSASSYARTVNKGGGGTAFSKKVDVDTDIDIEDIDKE